MGDTVVFSVGHGSSRALFGFIDISSSLGGFFWHYMTICIIWSARTLSIKLYIVFLGIMESEALGQQQFFCNRFVQIRVLFCGRSIFDTAV